MAVVLGADIINPGWGGYGLGSIIPIRYFMSNHCWSYILWWRMYINPGIWVGELEVHNSYEVVWRLITTGVASFDGGFACFSALNRGDRAEVIHVNIHLIWCPFTAGVACFDGSCAWLKLHKSFWGWGMPNTLLHFYFLKFKFKSKCHNLSSL